jgi:hypothetical protein
LKSKGLTSDQTIEFTGIQTAKKCPVPSRRIGYRDAETGKRYLFLTNNFELAARTIADIYKARWHVHPMVRSVDYGKDGMSNLIMLHPNGHH